MLLGGPRWSLGGLRTSTCSIAAGYDWLSGSFSAENAWFSLGFVSFFDVFHGFASVSSRS